MKTNHLSLLLAALLLPATLHAVPGTISYQGIVTDSTGVPVGNTTPENRRALFRIWKGISGGSQTDLVYSEQQTVTIANGEFSILIGNGGETDVDPVGFPDTGLFGSAALIAAFDGTDRFLEVTIADDADSLATPIAPRQQIVSTAYAMRAGEAETLVGGTITDGTLTGTIAASGATFNGGNFTSGTYSGNGENLSDLNGYNLQNGTVTADKLGPDVGFWETNGSNVYRDSGNVGIGETSPGAPLHVSKGNTGGNNASTATAIFEDDVSHFIQIKAPLNQEVGFLFGTLNHGADGGIVYNDNTLDGDEMEFRVGDNLTKMTITSAGNVGIGTTNPDVNAKLDVAGSIRAHNINIESAASGPGRYNILHRDTIDALVFRDSWGAVDRMVLKNDGRLGIGTTAPNAKLEVTTTDATRCLTLNTPVAGWGLQHIGGGINVASYINASGGWLGTRSNHDLLLMANNDERMRVKANGNVGIGTTNPTKAKLQVNGFATYNPGLDQQYTPGASASYTRWYLGPGLGGIPIAQDDIASGSRPLSIFASDYIAAPAYISFSDARIKSVKGRSDRANDLETLASIEITDYTYRDVIAKGRSPQKKLIAQQVEEVYPQAVSKITDVIPDIYEKASSKDGWIELKTDLKVGEQVRLITETTTAEYEVLEVAEGRFRTDLTSAKDKVFVYGREVDDFRSVDYDAISMLNVSATQELHRRLVASEEEVSSLKQRIAELEARDATRDKRLSAIESLLQSPERSKAQTVSVK